MKKILLILVGAITLFVLSSLSYVKFILPDVGDAPVITAPDEAGNIERGRYLANSVALCMDCHSVRDWSLFSGPPIPGTEGKGGEVFNRAMGLPGVYYSRNLTQYALSDWTDGEIFRAITSGVSKDGSALFPIMPHPNYARVDKNDILDIIAYIRTLKPIEYDPPASESDFPMNFIINTIPQEPKFNKIPDISDQIAYGKYMLTMASCNDCHTPFVDGEYDMSRFLSGGRELPLPWATLRSANLTPDVETGLGGWTEKGFVTRFKMYQDSAYVIPQIEEGDFMTVMPWLMYSTMEEHDLKAIFAYLQSLDPISNRVEKFTLNEVN